MTGFIVQQIREYINCGFNDTGMTFCTLLENTFLVMFGYRAIVDLTCDKIGSHFPIWPRSLSRQKEGLSGKKCGA